MTKPKVLLIDDEEHIIRACVRVLKRAGMDVLGTTDFREALNILSKEEISVVISDQRMPEILGADLLEKVKKTSPDTVRIILTGYADTEAAIKAINTGNVFRYIAKPWDDEELKEVVQEAADLYQQKRERQEQQKKVELQNEELLQHNDDLSISNDLLEKNAQQSAEEISELNTKLKNSLMGVIQVLAEMSEMHCPAVGSHSKRVATISTRMAKVLGYTGGHVLQFQIGAMLHDIGKIGWSAELLKKKLGPDLSLEERAEIEGHAAKGGKIVGMVDHLGEAAKYIHHHHENWNGTGYPDALAEKNIPIGSRIIAVANAYDRALNRYDENEMPTHESVLEELNSHSETLFDPTVLQALAVALEDVEVRDQLLTSEVDICSAQLRVGQKLSRDLKTNHGLLLLSKETVISKEQLARVRQFEGDEPINSEIYIYREQLVAT